MAGFHIGPCMLVSHGGRSSLPRYRRFCHLILKGLSSYRIILRHESPFCRRLTGEEKNPDSSYLLFPFLSKGLRLRVKDIDKESP